VAELKKGLILRWALWQSESQFLDLESRLGLFSDGLLTSEVGPL